MKLNQKGITLIELIAALALVSVITAGAWTALSIGLKHSAAETSKTVLQQDANLIVSTLSAAHRKAAKYNLKIENGHLMLQQCTTTDPASCESYEQVNDTKYNYTGTNVKTKNKVTTGTTVTIEDIDKTVSSPGTTLAEISFYPKNFHTDLKLHMTSGNHTITIDTSLTRIINSNN